MLIRLAKQALIRSKYYCVCVQSLHFKKTAFTYAFGGIHTVFKNLPNCLQIHMRVHVNFDFLHFIGQVYTVFYTYSTLCGYKNQGLAQET